MNAFSWFRPKRTTDSSVSALAAILESGPPAVIVDAAHQLICGLDPNGCVQTLVGYKNVRHIYLPVSRRLHNKQLEKQSGEQPPPNSVETLAKFLAEDLGPNEVARRRSYWFLYGLLLIKAKEIAEQYPEYQGKVCAIWDYLGESQDVIQNVLRDNILWSDDEKDIGTHNRQQRTSKTYI